MTAYEKHCKDLLKRRVERLLRIIELDAPNVLLANEVQGVRLTMFGLDPAAMAKVEARWLNERVRMGAGFCTSAGCDNVFDPALSFLPKCAPCTEAEDADAASMQHAGEDDVD